MGARLKARDSSHGFAAAGISWLGPVPLARHGGTQGMRAPGDVGFFTSFENDVGERNGTLLIFRVVKKILDFSDYVRNHT